MTSKIYTALLLFVFSLNLHAQNKLSLQDAYALALKNNFSIQVAKNDQAINENNNQIGNAGMLPSVLGTVNQDKQQTNTQQKFLSGSENNKTGAKSTNLNANVELGWTIFNGMKMFATKSKLTELQALGEVRLRQQIETIFSRIARAYYEVVWYQQQLKSAEKFILISEKRLSTAELKFSSGKSAKSEVLKAKVYLNADQASYKKLISQYKNSKLSLNQFMGQDLNTDFTVENNLLINDQIKLDEVMGSAIKENAGVLMSKMNQRINLLSVKEIRSERMPIIQLKTGYNYSKTTSEAGFLQSSLNNGFHYGAGVTMNLFNGFDVNRRLSNAQLLYQSSEIQVKDSLSKMQVALSQAYNTYATNVELWKFEKDNLLVAEQNFAMAQDQNEQGILSSNDLREAQVILIQNENRMLSAAFDAKVSEIELQRLSGAITKTP